MADVIQLLPDAIANQIAAGEVVQRPASVVKELLENSIDAGSTHIQLIIKDAGKKLIQVIDDGDGMSETDARLCFERHATSKIRNVNDLFSIYTLGFRGEAMASIAAVTKVVLKTCPKNQELGTHIVIEGSEVKVQDACQTPKGTSIAVKNLFYNVPARRNFLKSRPVETRHIVEEFQRIALANPKIFFSFHNNDVKIFHLPPASLRRRIVGLFGHNFNERLVPLEEETDVVRIYGFIGKPKFARKTRGEQYFFVNERFIKSNYLNHAVVSAYEEILPPKTYPLYVIFIDVDPARIDVNVHPTKQEIKFDDEKIVYTFVHAAVKRALGAYSVTPAIDFSQNVNLGVSPTAKISLKPKENNQKLKPITLPTKETSRTKLAPTENSNPKPVPTKQLKTQSITTNKTNGAKHKTNKVPKNWQEIYKTATINPAHKTITIRSDFSKQANLEVENKEKVEDKKRMPYQLHNQYILSQIKSGFILINQQAAHTRVLYEKYINILEKTKGSTQQLLFPKTIILPPIDAELLQEILPDVNELGYDIQGFGHNTFIIHGVPSDLSNKGDEQAVIDGLIEQFKQNKGALKLDKRAFLARIMAESNAIKIGQALNVEEMKNLVDQLFACATPYVAPNGRSTFVRYNLVDIERQFERKTS